MSASHDWAAPVPRDSRVAARWSASSPVLVGRRQESRALLDAANRPPAVALVEGEAGIGKTRLITELIGHPAIGDRTVLVGICHPLREPFPYGPILESLPAAVRALPAGTVLNPVVGALAPLLAEVADRLPAPPEPLDDVRAERHRLFRAVRELLAAVGPALLVIEDLHWADDGSRDLLGFLLDEQPEQLAVVLSYRREDLTGPSLPLGRAYRSRPGVSSVVITLGPLDVAGVRGLVSAIGGGREVSAELARRVHERTAGIPFVVEELVRDYPDCAPDALDRLPVPTLLRDAMVERLSALPPTATRVVRAAAVLQLPATEELLAAVAGGGLARCRTALGRVLRSGVLREVGGGRYGFRHALAVQAVYDSTSPLDRERLHRRAVRALGVIDPPPRVQLAHHCRRAGQIQAWLRHGEAAADHATAVGDSAGAVEVLESMLSDPELPAASRGRLAVKLSRAAVVGLTHRRVIRLLRRLLDEGGLPTGVRGEVRLNLGLMLSNQAGRAVAGLADLELAVRELRRRPALAARAMAALALPSPALVPLAVHQGWMERAEHLPIRDPAIATAVLANRVSLLMLIADPDVWEVLKRVPTEARSMAEAQQLARAYTNLAEAATWIGHYRAAKRFVDDGLRLAAESNAPFLVSAARGTELRLAWATGDWRRLADRAVQVMDAAVDIPSVRSDAQLVLGLLAVARGEWDEAEATLRACALSAPDEAQSPMLAAASAAMIRVQLARGEVAAAQATSERVVNRLRSKGVWVWAADMAPRAAAAHCRARQPDRASALVAEFETGIARRSAPLARAALDTCHGILAEAAGRFDEASAAYLRSRAGYDRLPRPYSAARAAEASIRCRVLAGDTAAAVEFAEPAETFAALGATRDTARCQNALRGTGLRRTWQHGRRGYGNALSPRERDVARLAGLGRTNREIAAVLFLSHRTVEQHVARALRKTGARTRAELADMLERIGAPTEIDAAKPGSG